MVIVGDFRYTRFMTSIEKFILKTITYFDIFGYPLTELELCKWLGSESREQIGLSDIQSAILSPASGLSHYIDYKAGFVFLKGRSELLKIRQERTMISDHKFKRARRVIKLFRLIPYLKMVAVGNTLAYQNPKETSDIDLLVVAKSGRIWTVRFCVVFILKLLQLRPGEAKRDPICPSFFLTEDSLNLEKIQLPGGPACLAYGEAMAGRDPYLQYWIAQLYPIFDPETLSEKFCQANDWIKTYLPNVIFPKSSKRRRVTDSMSTRFIRQIQEFDIRGMVGNFFEAVLKKFQVKILPIKLKQMANQDTRVIISDKMLKFHDDDRRAEFAEEYKKRLNAITFG